MCDTELEVPVGTNTKKRVWGKRTYTPEQKARRSEWAKEYWSRPDRRARLRALKRDWMRTSRYYEGHRDEVLQRVRAYQQANRETVRQRDREHYAQNRQRILQAQREYATRHRDLISARQQDRYKRDRERILAYHREYFRKNPEKHRAWEHARRARENGVPGRFSPEQFRELVQLHGGRCAYCGHEAKLVADHRIPLRRRELNPTNDIGNILPACSPCNLSKGTKTEDEFRDWLIRIAIKRKGGVRRSA